MSIRLEPTKKNSMKHFSTTRFSVFIFLFLSLRLTAQLTITMDHPDANYAVGETVHFQVHSTITSSATYTVTRGKYTDALASGTVQLTAGATTDVPILGAVPENLHFNISTGFASAVATVMVGADEMVPFESEPADFDAYWNGVKGQLAQVPMNPQVVPYNSTSYSDSYTVSLGNIDGRHVYGMLTVPKGVGPFPVVLKLPPYGSFPIQPETQFAERTNAITLSITIHNAPATQTDPNAYSPNDPSDRDLIYHKHSVTAGIRAIDYLTSRPDFNGTDVAVTGVSQGGGIGLLVAGLDSRVKLLAIGTPTMASHAGMLHGHPSGFPFYLRIPIINNDQQEIADVLQATKYYEASTAAKRYHGAVFLLTSYNDDVTIPETQFIASNFFDGRKVILHNVPGGHDNRPEEYLFGRFNYLRRYFPSSNNPPFPWSSTDKGYMANAGNDQTATVGVPIALTASIEDNTTTNPSIPVTWRKVSGPGSVSFSSPNAYNTNATFGQNGTYELEFRGKDTGLLGSKKLFYTISDRIVVTVGGGSGNPAPTVNLSTPSTTVNSAFQVTASFSESVTDVTLSDFTVSNGSLSNLTGTGSTYTFTVTPSAVGQVTIFLPANKAYDADNQGNMASNTLVVQYSTIQNQSIDLALDLTANHTTVALFSPVDFKLTLSNSGDVAAHNVTVSFKLPQGFGLLSSFPTMGSYNSWTGVWTLDELAAGASAEVHLTANVNTSSPAPFFTQVTAAQEQDIDSSPNNNAGPVPTEDDEAAVTITTGSAGTPPTVVLSTPSNTVSGSFVVTATFSESVTGLSASDFIVANGSLGAFSGSGDTYVVTVTPTVVGNVTVSLPVNAAHAASGLGNEVSNTLSVQYATTPSGEYCTPSATPWNDWIKHVAFGSINKYSNKEGYADFTDLSTDVAKGSSTEITIGLGHGYWIFDQYYRVWIDLNHDNDFNDPGELVLDAYVPPVANGTNPADFVGTIDIPNDATSGATRMRVALNRAGQPLPCGQDGYGEYEDYSVNIGGSNVNPGTYCASSSTPWNDWIARVQLNDINNSSGKDGYGDFTNLQTDVQRGANTTISITLGHGYFIYDQYYRMWIDINQDGDFDDANELVMSKLVPSSGDGTNPPALTGSIHIPDYALLGTTRMRVSLHRDSYGTACNQGGNGEVEDYTLNIIAGGTSGPTDYCVPAATPWHEWIARVHYLNINHASVKEGYGDFTAYSTDVYKGIPSQITITLGHGYWIYDEHYDIWIDLNQDGDFTDDGELLFSQSVVGGANGSNPAPVLGSILIPSNALNGETRMRVSMRRDNKTGNPCETTGFGEVEDYTVNILAPTNNLVYTHLLDFGANNFHTGVKTQWTFDNMADPEFFVLERAEGADFVAIQQFDHIPGENQREYWDPNPAVGMNYYRLKLVYQNGSVFYSPIASVQILPSKEPQSNVVLFPTITNGVFNLDLSDYRGLAAKIDLINATGQVVKHWQLDSVNETLLSLDIFGMKKGLYFVHIQTEGHAPLTEKLILRE